MSSYASDLSKKKVEALRALTDAPPWFDNIIEEAEGEEEDNKVEKGKNGSVGTLGTNKTRFKPTKTGSIKPLKIMKPMDHQVMNPLPF